MAFEIVELKKETFTGNKVEIPEFDPQKGFGPMSEIKESAQHKICKKTKKTTLALTQVLTTYNITS